jgi:hypothetical protein
MELSEVYRRLFIEAGTTLHHEIHGHRIPIDDCDIQRCSEVVLAKKNLPQSDWTMEQLEKGNL